MISFLLVAGIAYGIAYWISSTGLAYWRAFVGFMLGFITAWLGGGYLASMLLFPSGGDGHSMSQLIAKGMGWAILGAGFGVYRARVTLRTGNPAPPIVFPKWVLKVVGGMAVIGIAAAVGIPAYQDYTKGMGSVVEEVGPWSKFTPEKMDNNKPGMFDDLIPRNAVRNTTPNLTTAKRDKYEEFLDSPSSTVKMPNSFTSEEATGRSTQPNQSATNLKPFNGKTDKEVAQKRASTSPSAKKPWSGNYFDRFDTVGEIEARAHKFSQLNEQHAWAAVVAWQAHFMRQGNNSPANEALYAAVGTVLDGLKDNKGICRPGRIVLVDATSASVAVPVGSALALLECDR